MAGWRSGVVVEELVVAVVAVVADGAGLLGRGSGDGPLLAVGALCEDVAVVMAAARMTAGSAPLSVMTTRCAVRAPSCSSSSSCVLPSLAVKVMAPSTTGNRLP